MTDLNLAFVRWSNAEQDLIDATGVLTYSHRAPLSESYQCAQKEVVRVLQEEALKLRKEYEELANATPAEPPTP